MEKYTLFDGRVHIYKRPNSSYWQCSTYLGGRLRRQSTKLEQLEAAKAWAESWYIELRGRHRTGTLHHGKTFRDAATQFQREYSILTEGQRSPMYVEGLGITLRAHVLPFMGDMPLMAITSGTIQDYRIHRVENSRTGKPPARNTISNELIAVRQVLKTAQRHGWIDRLPDLSFPYKAAGKTGHRAWFSLDEYRRLYTATRRRAAESTTQRSRHVYEQLHDYVLFLANTGLRPDEAGRLEFRDVLVAHDEATNETILEIEVRGKTGIGHCKSTASAVRPFHRLRQRNTPSPTDRLFHNDMAQALNKVLATESINFDRDGNRRTAYSLRHTYICLRLMEGADIYQIAKNCRTSVKMIEKYYARHLKNTLDAAAINVRRPRGVRAAV